MTASVEDRRTLEAYFSRVRALRRNEEFPAEWIPTSNDITIVEPDWPSAPRKIGWNIDLDGAGLLLEVVSLFPYENVNADGAELANDLTMLSLRQGKHIETYATVRDAAEHEFAEAESEGLQVRLISVRPSPFHLGVGQELNITVAFESFDELLQLQVETLSIKYPADLEEDMESIREMQAPRAALWRDMGSTRSQFLVDDVTVRALRAAGVKIGDAIAKLDAAEYKCVHIDLDAERWITLVARNGMICVRFPLTADVKWNENTVQFTFPCKPRPRVGSLLARLIESPAFDPDEKITGVDRKGHRVGITPKLWIYARPDRELLEFRGGLSIAA